MGQPKKQALASALGEYFERLSTNYFFADFWLGETIANGPFVHYPNEKWFPLTEDDEVPEGLLDPRLRAFYDPDDQLTASMLVDLQSATTNAAFGGLPFTRQSDGETVYIPMNIVGNLYVSNGCPQATRRTKRAFRHCRKSSSVTLKTASSLRASACQKFRQRSWRVIQVWWSPSISWKPKVSRSLLTMARWRQIPGYLRGVV